MSTMDILRNRLECISGKMEIQPTLTQLKAICQCYKVKTHKHATRSDVINLLTRNNVKMHYFPYNGNKTELRGAIVHWIENPQTSDSDSSSSWDDSFESAISDFDSHEMNDEPLDTNASLAIYECCSPSHFNVQFEEEVEMVEYMDIADAFSS